MPKKFFDQIKCVFIPETPVSYYYFQDTKYCVTRREFDTYFSQHLNDCRRQFGDQEKITKVILVLEVK